MDGPKPLIIPLLHGFSWFDDGLQAYLRAKGWPQATRPQSMVMTHVVTGITRPTEIARALGVSRQAIHTTINQMVDMGLLELIEDSTDGRSKRVVITPTGQKMRAVAQEAMRVMTRALEARLGAEVMAGLQAACDADWGPPMTFEEVTEPPGPAPDPTIGLET